jgi:hypothetical protein
VLEPGDVTAQRLLGDEQARRRPPEMKLVGHSHEVAQAPQFD